MATVTKIPATVSRYTATPIQARVKRKVQHTRAFPLTMRTS